MNDPKSPQVCDFDRVPACTLTRRQYRKHCMQAEVCRECKSWFDTFGGQQKTSRHRISVPRPPTPPGFWELEMPDDDMPIGECTLPQDGKRNKYDIPIAPKMPSQIIQSKQGWKRAVKPGKDSFGF
ncbi:hypothetical protein JTE90_000374 [Oedothorax gibbosus]|uniref:DNA endonuclease activator Ctp1 C-terminal domain-containing protein n=1 Tax=Oedothorax gibbosus TaxID=931172 RepID=A0AAV6TS98_9ARAC|nr:hypothetical protein JTE90_008250 [Oedothorax gibbosus]KAG8174608.1 hypothetical protein JTE90_000374 [Oedothorax gibbosus]